MNSDGNFGDLTCLYFTSPSERFEGQGTGYLQCRETGNLELGSEFANFSSPLIKYSKLRYGVIYKVKISEFPSEKSIEACTISVWIVFETVVVK